MQRLAFLMDTLLMAGVRKSSLPRSKGEEGRKERERRKAEKRQRRGREN